MYNRPFSVNTRYLVLFISPCFYASQEGLEPIKERVYYEVCVRYKLGEDFLTAKPETMETALDYIDET